MLDQCLVLVVMRILHSASENLPNQLVQLYATFIYCNKKHDNDNDNDIGFLFHTVDNRTVGPSIAIVNLIVISHFILFINFL